MQNEGLHRKWEVLPGDGCSSLREVARGAQEARGE